jgi:hypothetical protein
MSIEPTTSGEVYLGAWSDTVESSTGRTDAWIKLYLSDSSMLDDLRSQDVRGKAKEGGKRYALVMVEIGDDEQPVQKPKGSMTHLSNVAAVLGENPKFGQWYASEHAATYEAMVESFGQDEWKKLSYKDKCRECILYSCSIASRSYLDTDEIAANTFKELISEPFSEYVSGL